MSPFSLDMPVSQFHSLAIEAVSSMIELEEKFDIPLNVCAERQMVHEIGIQLKQLNLAMVFEYRYPTGQGRSTKRADILAICPDGPLPGGQYAWVEVKSTGINSDCARENGLGSLNWKHDFDKLSELDDTSWEASHCRFWVWLYLFDTYGREVKERFGDGSDWTKPYPLGKMADVFGRVNGKPQTLGRVLQEIESCADTSTCSLIPTLFDRDRDFEFSALLVTCKIKSNSGRRH